MAIAKDGHGKKHPIHHKHHQTGHHVGPLAVVTNIPAPAHAPFVPTGSETRVVPGPDGVVHLPANATQVGSSSSQQVSSEGGSAVLSAPVTRTS